MKPFQPLQGVEAECTVKGHLPYTPGKGYATLLVHVPFENYGHREISVIGPTKQVASLFHNFKGRVCKLLRGSSKYSTTLITPDNITHVITHTEKSTEIYDPKIPRTMRRVYV